MGLWDWLFGQTNKSIPAEPLGSYPSREDAQFVQSIPAKPLKSYPSREDAQFAQQAGIGYGTPNDAYIQGLAGRAYGQQRALPGVDAFVPGAPRSLSGLWSAPAADIGGRGTSLAKQLQDAFTQAQIASNYLPVAALGLDPRRATADVSGREVNIPGAYSRPKDQIYFNITEPSALLHEATHRGLSQLVATGKLPRDLQDRVTNPTRQEFVVRQLMEQFAGDPEQGDADLIQKAQSKINPLGQDEIALMNAYVAELMKQRKPGGPR